MLSRPSSFFWRSSTLVLSPCGFGDGSPVGYADVGDVGSVEEEFLGIMAVGLKFAEFRGAFVQEAVGLGACPVDGSLDLFGARVIGFHGVKLVVFQ